MLSFAEQGASTENRIGGKGGDEGITYSFHCWKISEDENLHQTAWWLTSVDPYVVPFFLVSRQSYTLASRTPNSKWNVSGVFCLREK